MALSFVEDQGEKRCYVLGAPAHQDCESLARYFEKYWKAPLQQEFDVGTDAKYILDVGGAQCQLIHDSQLGNYIVCPGQDVANVLAEPLADLKERLSD